MRQAEAQLAASNFSVEAARAAFFPQIQLTAQTGVQSAALASLFEWVREANRRDDRPGDGDLREMLSVLGLEGLTPLEAVGDDILDVVTQGEMIAKDQPVRIIAYTGSDAIVETQKPA